MRDRYLFRLGAFQGPVIRGFASRAAVSRDFASRASNVSRGSASLVNASHVSVFRVNASLDNVIHVPVIHVKIQLPLIAVFVVNRQTVQEGILHRSFIRYL